ncbi:MAG: Gfo/Idh/MocA family oxidoreductase [Pseudomonadota bacterium]
MGQESKMRLRMFENSPGQRHIEPPDHYMYRQDAPAHAINIIGAGTIGQEHMRVAQLLGRARVHGIYDSVPHSVGVATEEFARLSDAPLATYESLEAACNDDNVDALIVCTPNDTHFDVLKVAMASGKAILLEKPMATRIGDAAAIVEMAAEYGAPLHVGLQYRFKAMYAESEHEVLERQSLGPIHAINLFEHRPPFLDKVAQWNKFEARSGGTLVEKCCHYFDLINRLANARPVQVYASGAQSVNFLDFQRDGHRADIMDNASVIINYANGVRATFELNMFSPNFHEQLVVCGERGRLVADERFETFHSRVTTTSLRIEHGEHAPSRNVSLAHAQDIEHSGHHGGTYFEHAAFLDSVEGRASAAATPMEGFWSLVVGAAAQTSAAAGRPVDVREWLTEHQLTSFAGEL